jgi:hypothetical protein
VIDTGYLYGQLFNMGYDDVYRVSGADGDPRNFNDSFNIASTINGWQEFWKNWKTQLTDTGAMSNVAKFATVSDHYFRRSPEQRTNPNYSFDANYRWDSDDAEVTIPGAACPGVRVLLAAHGDLTPVSPTIVGEINNPTSSTSAVDGFNAARRHITLSNLSNGGAYDDTSGVAMTMAEYQALLRWYAANHTYPSKTFKVALIDADAGRAKDGTYMREGSEYYAKNLIPKGPQGQYAMFATMNANGASYPAYHFGPQYYWNNVATGGVGPWHTFITDTPSAPNSLYPDTNGNIAANSTAISAFDADLKSAVTAGFAQQSLVLGHGHRDARRAVVCAAVAEVAQRDVTPRGVEPVDRARGGRRVVDLADDRRADRRQVPMRGDQHAHARAGRPGDGHLGVVGVPAVVGVERVVRVRPLLRAAPEVVIRDRGELRDVAHRVGVGQLGLPRLPELLPPVDGGGDVVRIAEVARVAVRPRHAVDVVVAHVEQLAVHVGRVDHRGYLPGIRPRPRRRYTAGDHYRRRRCRETSRDRKRLTPLQFAKHLH